LKSSVTPGKCQGRCTVCFECGTKYYREQETPSVTKQKRCHPLYRQHFRNNAACESTQREGLQIPWQVLPSARRYVSFKKATHGYITFSARFFQCPSLFIHLQYYPLDDINTLRTGSYKLFKRLFPGFLTILTL
jgi:hypothetical protein